MKKATPLIGVAAAALLLTACSSGSGDSDATTISFSGQTQEQELWETLFQAFEEANPGYSVDATFTPNDSYPQLVQTQLQSGQAADVIQTTPGTGGGLAALTLAAGGRVADLSAASWASELPVTSEPLVTLDGKVYAYPTDVAPLVTVYNPDIFASAGVEVPQTFDELLETCPTIKDTGVTPIALAGGSFQNVSITLQTLAANDVFGPDPDWNEQRASGETTFADSDGWKKVLEDFSALIDAGCYGPDVSGVQAPVHLQQFASGQAAMVVLPAQGIQTVEANASGDLALSSFAFPADAAEDTKVSAASGISLVVNDKAKSSEGAQKLLDFLSTPEERAAYSEKAGTIAPGAGEGGSDIIPEVLQPIEPFLNDDRSLTLNYLSWPSAGVAQQLATSAQGLFTGQKTIEQVLSDADKAWDDASK